MYFFSRLGAVHAQILYNVWSSLVSLDVESLLFYKYTLQFIPTIHLQFPYLFKQNFILKLQNKICQENSLFVSKSLNNLSSSFFNTWFSFFSDQHNYESLSFTQGNLMKLFYKTNRYGKYSITVSAVESWNKIQKQLKSILLKDLCPNKIKTVVTNFFSKSY